MASCHAVIKGFFYSSAQSSRQRYLEPDFQHEFSILVCFGQLGLQREKKIQTVIYNVCSPEKFSAEQTLCYFRAVFSCFHWQKKTLKLFLIVSPRTILRTQKKVSPDIKILLDFAIFSILSKKLIILSYHCDIILKSLYNFSKFSL